MVYFIGKVLEIFNYSDEEIKASDMTIQASIISSNGNCVIAAVPEQIKEIKEGDYVEAFEEITPQGVILKTLIIKILGKKGKKTFDEQKKMIDEIKAKQQAMQASFPTAPQSSAIR